MVISIRSRSPKIMIPNQMIANHQYPECSWWSYDHVKFGMILQYLNIYVSTQKYRQPFIYRSIKYCESFKSFGELGKKIFTNNFLPMATLPLLTSRFCDDYCPTCIHLGQILKLASIDYSTLLSWKRWTVFILTSSWMKIFPCGRILAGHFLPAF